MARFATKIRGFPDAHPSLIMQTFLMGLKPSRFFWSLIEKPSVTIPEMLQRANQYIVAEALEAGKRMNIKRSRAEQSRGTTSAAPVQPC